MLATLVTPDTVTSFPEVVTAFVCGFGFPLGLFSIWLVMRAVRKGVTAGSTFTDSQ